ncbi:MAG: hypothetical protein ACTSV3_06625 [Candidatus Thorarchaeota archaeon]|nr:MAG: hypothetical protein DRP09_07970 [Candidatus Thorarchaeota archaeon]
MDSLEIHLTRLEAEDNGMPPMGFSVDVSEDTWASLKFPDPECYLRMSIGPSRSLSVIVASYKSEIHGHDVLSRIIGRVFYNGRYIPLRAGKKTRVTLDGVERIAQEFTTSRSANKKRWSAALVPSPDGAPYGLLVAFGLRTGARRTSLLSVLDNPIHAGIAQSFALESS